MPASTKLLAASLSRQPKDTGGEVRTRVRHRHRVAEGTHCRQTGTGSRRPGSRQRQKSGRRRGPGRRNGGRRVAAAAAPRPAARQKRRQTGWRRRGGAAAGPGTPRRVGRAVGAARFVPWATLKEKGRKNDAVGLSRQERRVTRQHSVAPVRLPSRIASPGHKAATSQTRPRHSPRHTCPHFHSRPTNVHGRVGTHTPTTTPQRTAGRVPCRRGRRAG